MPIGGEKQSFTNENVEEAPEKHGVYALYDGNTIIYNGRAAGEGVTIRSRLKDHKSGREGKCTQGATHYKREVIDTPTTREKELLKEYEDEHGKLPKCNDVMP